MVKDVLRDPDSFFRTEARQPSRIEPILVVFAAATTSSLIPVIILNAIHSAAPEKVRTYILLFGGLSLLGGALSIVGIWLVLSVTLHFVSFYLGGNGSLRKTITIAGWGFLPMVATNLFNSVIMYRALYGPMGVRVSGHVTAEKLTSLIATNHWLVVTKVISSMGLVWMAFLWMFVAKHTHELPLKRSMFAAVVPISLLSIYWYIFGF